MDEHHNQFLLTLVGGTSAVGAIFVLVAATLDSVVVVMIVGVVIVAVVVADSPAVKGQKIGESFTFF